VIAAVKHLLGGAPSELARSIIVQENVGQRVVFMPRVKTIHNGKVEAAGQIPKDTSISKLMAYGN